MLGEYGGGTAGVSTYDHGDRCVGQFQVRVGGDDLWIVPARDLAQKDVGVNVAWQLQALGIARQVVGQHDFTRCHRQQLRAFGDLGNVFILHCRVTGREINGFVQEVLDTCTTALGLVIHGHASGFLAEILEPGEVNRSRKTGTGTCQANAFRSERHRAGAKRNRDG
ncbi:hypothetical protein D3C86_1570260 [compost metagenome]